MARVVLTARADKRRIDNVVSGLRVIASKEFVARGFGVEDAGDKVLAFIKKIFPKSPPTYPSGRPALANGWRLYRFPPKQDAVGRFGFTVRRAPRLDQDRDSEIIRALDQGSRAYERNVPAGQVGSLFVTNAATNNPQMAEIGDMVFFTSSGQMLQFRARQGLHFMDKTYEFALALLERGRQNYRQAVKERLKNG